MVTRDGILVFDPLDIVDPRRLKRDLLLVDHMIVDSYQISLARSAAELLCSISKVDVDETLGRFDADFNFLKGEGLLSEISFEDEQGADSFQKEIDYAEMKADENLARPEPFLITHPDGSQHTILPLLGHVMYVAVANLLRARGIAASQSNKEAELIPFGSPMTDPMTPDPETRRKVLRVVLHNLPIPNSDTTWDRLLDFKFDDRTRHHLAQLRGWMVDVSAKEQSELDIATRLEAGLEDYRAHMRFSRMEADIGSIEAFVVSTAEIMENVVRLKFGAVAKGLFSLFKGNMATTKAELTSPGKQLAFIDAAQGTFGSNA
ncbi:MAG: hypothetical protein GY799_07000 [Desulfobulbaceae bacterium]|nr:hypothetical protein [Desulfobulbaceae bacterium]